MLKVSSLPNVNLIGINCCGDGPEACQCELNVTIDTDEPGPLAFIWQAVTELGATPFGSAIMVQEDLRLLLFLKERGERH